MRFHTASYATFAAQSMNTEKARGGRFEFVTLRSAPGRQADACEWANAGTAESSFRLGCPHRHLLRAEASATCYASQDRECPSVLAEPDNFLGHSVDPVAFHPIIETAIT